MLHFKEAKMEIFYFAKKKVCVWCGGIIIWLLASYAISLSNSRGKKVWLGEKVSAGPNRQLGMAAAAAAAAAATRPIFSSETGANIIFAAALLLELKSPG